MPSIVKNLFLSKKFVVALITTIGAVAAHFGLEIDVTDTLVFMTPLMVYVGAMGWVDAGKEREKIAAETALKRFDHEKAMHFASVNNSLQSGPRGFARVHVIAAIALFTAAATTGSLVSGCANPGRSSLGFGRCVLDEGVLGDVLRALEQQDYVTEVKAVAVGHTVGIVQCALKAIAAQPDAVQPDAARAPDHNLKANSGDSRSYRARRALEALGPAQ